jgi:hypothetical protein
MLGIVPIYYKGLFSIRLLWIELHIVLQSWFFFFFILSLNDYYIYNIVIYVVKVKIWGCTNMLVMHTILIILATT